MLKKNQMLRTLKIVSNLIYQLRGLSYIKVDFLLSWHINPLVLVMRLILRMQSLLLINRSGKNGRVCWR